MQSRTEKYQADVDDAFERSKKNTKLYEDVYDDMYRDTTYKNMSIIDSAKEVNIGKLKNILDDKYDTRQYRTLKNYSMEDVETDEKPDFMSNREKVHDINEVINEAKNKRAFIEETKEKQKYTDFTERRNKYNDPKYENMEKEEKELEDLINTMAVPKISKETEDELDMFDLKGDENTIVTSPIEASFDTTVSDNTDTTTTNIQKTLVRADKTFYTDSNMFTKNDFEDFGKLSKELTKSNKLKKAIIIILIILIIGVASYLILTKYIIK